MQLSCFWAARRWSQYLVVLEISYPCVHYTLQGERIGYPESIISSVKRISESNSDSVHEFIGTSDSRSAASPHSSLPSRGLPPSSILASSYSPSANKSSSRSSSPVSPINTSSASPHGASPSESPSPSSSPAAPYSSSRSKSPSPSGIPASSYSPSANVNSPQGSESTNPLQKHVPW